MRSIPVTEKALDRIFNLFNEAGDTKGLSGRELHLMIGAFQHEQYQYQQTPFHELARTYLLFIEQELDDPRYPQRDWRDVFGVSLQERMQAVFVISVAVELNGGLFDRTIFNQASKVSWLELADLMGMKDGQFQLTVDDLTATIQQAQEYCFRNKELEAHLKRFSLNPLARYPLIDLGSGPLVAPQHFFIRQTMTVSSLFFRGCETWKDDFAKELGFRVEAYTGSQLEYAGFKKLLPEISYGKKKETKLSIDWFALTDDTVLLIECKSAKIPQSALAGSTSMEDLMTRSVGKAREQLKTSSELIIEEDPNFSEIPKELNQIGLIVTAEPIRCANDIEFHGHLVDPGIPCLAVSLRDLEMLTALGAQRMVKVVSDIVSGPNSESWNNHDLILHYAKPEGVPENRIIADAYEKFILPFAPSETLGDAESPKDQ